jgi:hypothetical protein
LASPILINIIYDVLVAGLVIFALKKKIFNFEVPCIGEIDESKKLSTSVRSLSWIIFFNGALASVTFCVNMMASLVYNEYSLFTSLVSSLLLLVIFITAFWLISYANRKGAKIFNIILTVISIIGIIFYFSSIILTYFHTGLVARFYLIAMSPKDYGMIIGTALNGLVMVWFSYVLIKNRKVFSDLGKSYHKIANRSTKLAKYQKTQKYLSLTAAISFVVTIACIIPNTSIFNIISYISLLLFVGVLAVYLVLEVIIDISLNKLIKKNQG